MKRSTLLVVTSATAAALLAGRPADAYVRYTSNTGKMFKWPQSCVAMVVFPNDLLGMMTRDEIINAVDSSAATWSKGADSCTYLDITMTSSADATPRAINDGRNNVIFRATSWCKQNAAGDCDTDYDAAALALTSVSASTSSGIIRDADIEVNAYHFSWADLVTHPDLRGGNQLFHDLQNAVTHEMGHVIGLDHTCYLQGPPPLDNTGQPIPDCANASPDVLATTMFPSANPGDIDKRDLAPDDQQAVCDIYPAAEDPKTCSPGNTDPGGCSCATVGGTPSSVMVVIALLVGGLVVTRTRRRRG